MKFHIHPSGIWIRICAALLFCFLLIQLHLSSYLKEKNGPVLSDTALKIIDIYTKITNDLNTEAYPDRTGMYKIMNIIHRRRGNVSSFDVTYISQCSWNKFHLIGSLLDIWEGPVSVAVFSEVRDMDEIIWRISAFVYCHRFRELYLSLVVPARDMYVIGTEHAFEIAKRLNGSELCSPVTYMNDVRNMKNYNWSTPYPVNLLRNVAKRFSISDYILVTDIDILPNRDLRRNFLRYIWSKRKTQKKVVFVVPAFEMAEGVTMPETKSDLIPGMQKGNIRPFYYLPCKKCQVLTNYTKWFSYPNIPGTRALYKIEWQHPWEPFYISHRDVPNYDERFKQYGFNRISQACQLYMEGYSFLVLDNVFLVHRGFKSMLDFHDTKQEEMVFNRKLYEEFQLEMVVKYPNSGRKCER